MLGMEMRVNR